MAVSLPCSLHGASPGTRSQIAWCSPPLALGFSGSCAGDLGLESTPSPWSSSTVGLQALEKGIPGTTGWRGARGSAAVVRSMSRDVLTQGREVQEVGDLCLHAGEVTLSNGDCAARNTLPAWQLRKRFMRYRANTGPTQGLSLLLDYAKSSPPSFGPELLLPQSVFDFWTLDRGLCPCVWPQGV